MPKHYSFINIIFDSSYRKLLDNEVRSIELFKEYEINYNLIEEKMTDLLLKNKKLLNDEVIEFIYRNEVFDNQVTNLITLFKERYKTKNIDIFDKVAIYKFYEDNKNNSHLLKNMISDFKELIKYLNIIKNENTKINDINITEETKIYEAIKKLNDTFSNNFIKIFENNDGLTIDKTSEIFLYYLKLSFDLVKEELNCFQNELDDKSKEIINDFYQKEHPISKKDFSHAIRLFTTLVLFLEEDKENKIKYNLNNLVKYLIASDLWSSDLYDDKNFNKNLYELETFKAQVNQIISLYEYLGGDIESNFAKDAIEQIEKENKPKNPLYEIADSGSDDKENILGMDKFDENEDGKEDEDIDEEKMKM